MALSTTTSRVSYVGNGVTTLFAFPYYFLANADLVIIKKNLSTGVETTQVITTNYTVTGAGVAAGGSITMLVAPTASESVTIYRNPAATQDLDLRENDSLPAEETERAIDKVMMIAQRLLDLAARSIRLSDGFTSAFSLTLPANLGTPNATLVLNATGDAIVEGPTTTSIVTNTAAAAASAAAAAASAAAAAGSATSSGTSASASSASSIVASLWAISLSLVDGVNYGAKYYALQAAATINNFLGSVNVFTALNSFNIFAFLKEVNSTTTGANQTLNPTKVFHIVTNASLSSVDMILPGGDGGLFILKNATGNSIYINNLTGATAANQILTGTNSNLLMKTNTSLLFIYDNNASKWQIIGGSGGGGAAIFGTTGSGRSVGTGGLTGSTNMSTTETSQVVFVVSSGGEVDITTNPQVQAGTIIGQYMEIHGTSDTDYNIFEDGNGMSMNGSWNSYQNNVLGLRWNGSVWTETHRRG